MAVKVLGPLDIDGEALSPRERAVLSVLVVRLGSTVSPAELADAWWGDAPPKTWEQQVRNSIARIRGRLGRASVETLGWEYRLGLDPDTVDAVRFERLVSSARGHALRGEHDRAIDGYRRALALWRGAPLQDVVNWEPGVVEALRLGEVRASAEEELLDARLAAGESRSLIADAERLLREEPLREERWAIVALANYRAGRQAEALATVRAARGRLADELGIEPGARLAALELAILRQDASLDAPTTAAEAASTCPYPGLRAFGPDDAEFFFGRDADVETVLDRVLPGAVVTIAGASGSGKSSMLLAGVLPRLRARGLAVEVVRPGGGRMPALRAAAEHARVVAVDQAEELLAASPAEIAEFAQVARRLLDDGGTIVATLRSDALDRVRALPEIGDAIGRGVYLLGPLSESSYRRAIEEPARRSGLFVEAGLVELAVRDSGDRAATLPHLSHALQETWVRREGATLTVAGYLDSGGIAGAIALSAEDVFRSLQPGEQELCRSLLLRLVDRGPDGVSQRRRVAAEPLLADASRRRVIERLARARLVTLDDDAVVVAHEAVATAWPRLDAWLEEDAEGSRTLRAVEAAADAWDAGGRDDDDLLRGARLHSALAWQESALPDLTERERALLDASAAHEQREMSALSARAARDRRRNRVLGASLAGAAVLLVAAVVAGSLAAVSGRQAADAAENARIEAIVSTSLALRSTDREVAALLAAEAYRRWPDDGRVRSALWGTMTTAGGLVATNRFDATFASVSAIPGTGQALAVVEDGERAFAQIVDASTGAVVRRLDVDLAVHDTRFSRDLLVSDDGSLAVVQTPQLVVADDVSTCCWNAIDFIDLRSGDSLPGSQLLRMRTSTRMVLDSATTTLYLEHPITGDVIAVDGVTGEYRASSPRSFDDYTGKPGFYGAIARVDADRIATGAGDRVSIFDAATLRTIRTIDLPAHMANWAMISDGAGGLLLSGDSATARLDVDSGSLRWTRRTTPSQVCDDMALLPSRGTFLCQPLGAVVEYSVEDGAPTGLVFRPQLDDFVLASLVDPSTVLLSAPQSSLWFVMRLDGGGPISHPAAHGRRLADGPDDVTGLVPTAAADGGAMQLWDFAADAPVGPEAEGLATLGSGIVERWDGSDDVVLEDLTSGDTHAYDVPGLPADFQVFHGDGLAFVAFSGVVIAIDPADGRPVGEPIELAEPYDEFSVLSISSTPDGERAVVTWWDGANQRTVTSTAVVSTGAHTAPEIYDVDGSIVISEDDVVTVSDETVTRMDLDTHRFVASLPRAAGGSRALSVSPDGRTLLNVGWNHRLTLYDLAADVVLGDPIDVDSADDALGGVLSSDGRSLYSNAADGILVWNLDPAEQAAAACRLAGRELTSSEWATYLHDLGPHTKTCVGQLASPRPSVDG